MDIVIIPAYYRPEYLSLCLEYLSKADGARDNKEYWVCQDFRYADDHRYGMQARWTKEVIENSPLPVKFIQRQPHSNMGNSMNTLEAYKEAYQTEADYVYLVEEDCLTTPDFFTWHEAVQRSEPDTMCSIAYRCSRNHEAKTGVTDAAEYFVTRRDFASIGVCWRRRELGPVVAHAKAEYYCNPEGYILQTFPGNRFAGDFCEQDGLIMRVMWEQHGYTVWPYLPRAFHVGNIGYHRPNGRRGEGHLKEKIDFLRSWIHDAEKIKVIAPDFGDIEPVPIVSNPSFEVLRKVQEFE